MVDLHSHILPGIDDGPNTIAESITLIKMEMEDGVDTIALTPHFACEAESALDFCKKRAASLKELESALKAENIKINLVEGAEVFISPEICKSAVRKMLCYSGTQFMLVELSSYHQAVWTFDVLRSLVSEGTVPVIAHIERYDKLMSEPELIYELIDSGALIQVNAESLIYGRYKVRSKLYKLMEHNLIHIIATDTHSQVHRPPLLRTALDLVLDKYGEDKSQYFIKNSQMIIDGKSPKLFEPLRIKKGFY